MIYKRTVSFHQDKSVRTYWQISWCHKVYLNINNNILPSTRRPVKRSSPQVSHQTWYEHIFPPKCTTCSIHLIHLNNISWGVPITESSSYLVLSTLYVTLYVLGANIPHSASLWNVTTYISSSMRQTRFCAETKHH